MRLRSKPKIGQIAISDSDPGVGHQDAVDQRQKAAKETPGRSEGQGGSLWHFPVSLIWNLVAFQI
jgi:hypothetical protein